MAEASCSLRIALVLSYLALTLTIVGMASPYWIDLKIGHLGIWKMCNYRICFTVTNLPGDEGQDSLKALKAMEIIGAVFGAGAITANLLCVFVEYFGRNKLSHLGAMLANLLAAGFVLSGVIIFLVKFLDIEQEDFSLIKFLSWAFALNIVGGFGFLASGLLMICDVRQRW